MKKKKILVLDNQMQLGGVCIAAVNFIENMKTDYDIDFVLALENGELDNRIPSGCNVDYIPMLISLQSYTKKTILKKYGFKGFIYKAILKPFILVFGYRRVLNFLTKFVSKNEVEYDFAINNSMGVASSKRNCVNTCHQYIQHCVKAKQIVLVIHGDFIANKYNPDIFKQEYIPNYNKIIVLTESAKKQMEELFPEDKNKFVVIPNFEADKTIKEMSNEFNVNFGKSAINFISVSRLTELKGYMRALNCFKKLKEEGYDFYWHIVGEGEQRSEIENYINNNNLANNVILHGLQKNPYPYFKAADCCMLLSYHESYGLVLIESFILGRPVIATETLASKEIVEDNYGWVCENDEEAIYNQIKYVLDNEKELKTKTNNLKDYEFDNKSIKEKFEGLINEFT